MRNVHLPARVAEEHSETAYMTREAMRFVEDMGEQPWFLHLSYVKPHWPYMAPAPYHALYGASDCLPVNRDELDFWTNTRCWRPTASTRNWFLSSAPRLRAGCGRPTWA